MRGLVVGLVKVVFPLFVVGLPIGVCRVLCLGYALCETSEGSLLSAALRRVVLSYSCVLVVVVA